MKRIQTILPTIAACIIFMGTLTGCDEVQIFQENVDPNALVPLKDTELEDDTYYVKNNTNFYKVYMPTRGCVTNDSSVLDESRVLITMDDNTLIPNHYSNELVAFPSDKLSFTEVTLERFADLGYSIGAYNGDITDEGYLYFNTDEDVVSDSSFGTAISETESTDIRVVSIDGELLTTDQINTKCGVITGLEKDKTYLIGYYAGTKYFEKEITADCRVYEAYEMYSYDESYISDTPNGYMAFNTPTDLKSGYYNINGHGLFRYYNFERGTQDENEVAMNDSYYQDEQSKIEAYSRQYNISVPNRVKDMKVTVELQKESLAELSDTDSVQGVIFAPDGTKLDMEYDEEEKELTISMTEAMAGDWTLNVMPKSVEIENVDVETDEIAQEATCEETEFTLPADRENIEFIAEYTKSNNNEEVTIFGTIQTEDGHTYDMTVTSDTTDSDNPKHYISYELPYAAAGKYIVRIYHYPEETTINTPVVQDKTETNTDIIVIEG